MTDKQLPHDIEAEQAIIGSLLIDGDCMSKVAYNLKPNDFYYEQNQSIYEACMDIFRRSGKVNQITLGHELQDKGQLKSIGGVSHLSHLVSICPTSLDIEYYAGVVKELSSRRALIALSDQLSAIGYDSGDNIPDKITGLVKDYLVEHSSMAEYISPAESGGMVLDLINKYNQPKWSMKWGFRDLDELTSGIFPGELTIIGARPRIGKTQLMIDVAQNIVDEGKSVLFCSAEMTVEHILERRVARELGRPIKVLRRYGVDDNQMDSIVELSAQLSESKLYFLRHGASSFDVYNKALKIKESLGLDIVFIDYLQKLRDCYSEKENENVRIGRACQRVHDIAVDLNIPVICAAQFNRNQEYRSDDNKAPVISDLRGCVVSNTVIDCLDYPRTIRDIYQDQTMVEVKTYNKFGGYEYVNPSMVLDTGKKKCIRVKTKLGAILSVSLDTPVNTDKGWVKAGELELTDKIAVDTSALKMVISKIEEDADIMKQSRKGIRFNTGRTHFKKGQIPWNKGLTKETSAIVARIGNRTSKALKNRPSPKPENYSEIMRQVHKPMPRKNADGYVMLYLPEYEGSNKGKYNWGRVLEHRYVMEQHLGRLLLPAETVHHLDGNKENNNIENLILCKNVREHTTLHQKEQKFVESLIAQGVIYYDRKAEQFSFR